MPNWTNNQFVNSLLVGSRVTNTTINYFLDPSGGAWSPAAAASIAAATQAWMNVANINFVQVNDINQAHFVEKLSTTAILGDGTLADHTTPADAYASNTVVGVNIDPADPLQGRYAVDANGWDAGGLTVGGDAHMTLLHELGHGLGLDHSHSGGAGDPHVFPGVTEEQSPGTNGLNDALYTVMSYRKGPNVRENTNVPNDNNYGNPATPMAFDTAAIQFLYGANTTIANGNNNYVIPDGAGAGNFWSCIWDTGGVDSIVYGGVRDTTIDLRSATLLNAPGGGGFASNAAGIFGGFTIAADFTNALADVNGETGVIIEHAVGGSGDDTMTGNRVNNILVGGGGADTMAGGDGNDSFYVENAGDLVAEAAGALAGLIDTIFASITYISALNVERMYLTGAGNINGTGVNGQNDIMYGNSGNNILNGFTGTDNMNGGLGNDSYHVNTSGDVINEAAGAGTLDTIFAATSYTIAANVERLFLLNGGNYNANGRNGQNDILSGNSQNNFINGFSGNDTIHGGLGNDTLTGGSGLDTFQFLTAPNTALNRDIITDFNIADDTIQMDNAIYTLLGVNGVLAANLFKNLNLGAQDADDRILYNDTSGAIFYDTNGLTAGGVIQFATLTGSPTVTAADFVVV